MPKMWVHSNNGLKYADFSSITEPSTQFKLQLFISLHMVHTKQRGAEVQTRELCLPKQHFNWRVDWSPFEESTKMKHLTFTLYLVKIFPIAFVHANQGTFLETLVHQTLFQGNCLSLGPSRTWSKNYLKISCF